MLGTEASVAVSNKCRPLIDAGGSEVRGKVLQLCIVVIEAIKSSMCQYIANKDVLR